jgi:outer membrane protein TolC
MTITDTVGRYFRGCSRLGCCTGAANLIALCFILCVVGAPAAAQTPQTSTRVFTLRQAVDYALANYPAVRAALSQVNAAREGTSVARAAYLPEANSLWQANRATHNNITGTLLPQGVIPSISGPVPVSTSDSSAWGSAAGLWVSWAPFDFGYRSALVNVARSGQSTAEAQAAVTRLDVAVATVNAYLALLAAQQVTQTARADVGRREVLATSVGVLVQNQLRPGADASRAQADLAQAHIRLIRAQTAENASRASLAALLGLAGSGIDVEAGSLLDMPSEESLPAQDLATNPIAMTQMSRIAEALARNHMLAKSYFPKLTLQSAFSGRGSGLDAGGQAIGGSSGLGLQRGNWAAGLQITFPILQIFTIRGERRIEQANEATERARYDQTLLDISNQTAQAQIRLDGARQVAQNTPAEVIAARDAEQQARARYEAGLATLVEVSETQSLLVQAEIDDALARLSVWRGLAELAGAHGDLRPFLDLLGGSGP